MQKGLQLEWLRVMQLILTVEKCNLYFWEKGNRNKVFALWLSTNAKKRPTKGRFLYRYALHEHCQRAVVCHCPVAYDCGNGRPKLPFMGRITSEDRGYAGD